MRARAGEREPNEDLILSTWRAPPVHVHRRHVHRVAQGSTAQGIVIWGHLAVLDLCEPYEYEYECGKNTFPPPPTLRRSLRRGAKPGLACDNK